MVVYLTKMLTNLVHSGGLTNILNADVLLMIAIYMAKNMQSNTDT